MKLTSYFSAFRKMLLVGAVLLCMSELSAGRSILNQERGEIDVFRMESARSNDFFMGALTLDNIYSFDFATAGIGTVVFRAGSNHFRPFVVNQDLPRAVGHWASSSESSSFISSNFVGSSQFYVGVRSFVPLDDQLPASPDIPAIPEPSTWLSGALALVAMGFARRRWLRSIIARA